MYSFFLGVWNRQVKSFQENMLSVIGIMIFNSCCDRPFIKQSCHPDKLLCFLSNIFKFIFINKVSKGSKKRQVGQYSTSTFSGPLTNIKRTHACFYLCHINHCTGMMKEHTNMIQKKLLKLLSVISTTSTTSQNLI